MNELLTQSVDTPVVDVEALERQYLGNLDLVSRVLKKFSTQLDSDLAELARALTGSDSQSFALVAHRIKGMSANVEARDLYEQAATAEQCAVDQAVSELPSCLERMRRERSRIAESLVGIKIKS